MNAPWKPTDVPSPKVSTSALQSVGTGGRLAVPAGARLDEVAQVSTAGDGKADMTWRIPVRPCRPPVTGIGVRLWLRGGALTP
ncbi:hypothetical protein [Streptomyces sp. NPDC048521]|uniref:hypothetical protein n=1 Tax=Streptomyces sp. NPDC048521 TaxID=3365566 RepID=UPI00370FF300